MRPESEYRTRARARRTGRERLRDRPPHRHPAQNDPRLAPRQTQGWGAYASGHPNNCPLCSNRHLDTAQYAYLLGLYLGDGCISQHKRDVYRLRVTLDIRYPGIINECAESMSVVRSNPRSAPGIVSKVGCVEVSSYWKHWPCLFPQHGPGRKHLRVIELECWQRWISMQSPEMLLRGLIHSDGWRGENRVQRRAYSYSQYQFTNHSDGIRNIFCDACDVLGIRWRVMTAVTIAISRRADVGRMDEFIGPKQ